MRHSASQLVFAITSATAITLSVATPARAIPPAAAPTTPVIVTGSAEAQPGATAHLLAAGPDGRTWSSVASATIDRNGSYKIPSPDLGHLAKDANPDGLVNTVVLIPTQNGDAEPIDVVVDIGSKESPALRRTLIMDQVSAGAARKVTAPGADNVARSASASATQDGLPEEVPLMHVPAPRSHDQRVASGSATAAASCRDRYIRTLGRRKVFTAGHYATSAGARTTATMETGASSRLGVGVSATGKFGTFRTSGEAVRSRSTTTKYPSGTSNQHNYSYWQYNMYRRDCTRTQHQLASRTYRAVAGTFRGGATYIRPSATPAAWKCEPYRKGSSFTLNRNRAWRNYYGADLGGPIGVNLSAETGYTTKARIYFNVNRWSVRLCGTNNYPGNYPQRIVVRTT
ncbi:hypothetical protein GCM10027055_13430 [Janibacter alkaliphilus]|uniref:Uncharacterized protein n=1 Tax=Janibacter alkaliphilus TaxID=1069963 RepID=A0A852X3M8_9MICO|nr:hypothetical protein [Janibacter alkaliphilus]